MDEFDESEASDEDVADDPDPAHLANYLRINPNLLLDHIARGPNPVTRWNFHDQEQLPAIPEEEEEDNAGEEVDEHSEEILQSSELEGSRWDDSLNS
jgi:hypothetical protein